MNGAPSTAHEEVFMGAALDVEDEQMLAVLAALDEFPSEHVEAGLAEAYALRHTPIAEQRALRAYARSSSALAPVVPLTRSSGRRALEGLRAA